ncbi:hypothetical protein HDV01_000531 [Terramyces sp. JEL0728]|nr:hypothetical protein HDV01_000531 [Terramyces sp. JEL0728]
MKLWLRELADGVIPKDLFKTFEAASGSTEETAIALQRLANTNYETLKYIVKFLAVLISNSEKNKMVIKNVCIVFGPTLFKCPSDCAEDASPSSNFMNESLKTSNMLKFIIENQEKLFINDEYRTVKEKIVDVDETNIKKSNSMESLSSEPCDKDVKFTPTQHQEINKLVKSTVASFISGKLDRKSRSSSFTLKKEDSVKEDDIKTEGEKPSAEKEKMTKKKSFSFSLKRSKSQIKDKGESKDTQQILSPLSNVIADVLYDDTPRDAAVPQIKDRHSRENLLKSCEDIAPQARDKSSKEDLQKSADMLSPSVVISPAVTSSPNLIGLPNYSKPPEHPVSTPKFKRVGKSIPKLNTSTVSLLTPIEKKFEVVTPISPSSMAISDSNTPTASGILNFDLKPPKRPPPATPVAPVSPKYLPGTKVRSSILTKNIQSVSNADVSKPLEITPASPKGATKLQNGRAKFGSAEQLTTPVKQSPVTPASAFVTDFSTGINPTENKSLCLSTHLPGMPGRPAPPPPLEHLHAPSSPKREQHLSFLPASPISKKKSPLSPSVTNFTEPRVLSFMSPHSSSSDSIDQKKHKDTKNDENSPPLLQTAVRNRSKKLKKVDSIERKGTSNEDSKSPNNLSPTKSIEVADKNEENDNFVPLEARVTSTNVLGDKSPTLLSQELFKKSKSQLSKDDIKEVKETFKSLQALVKESKCSESDLAQYKSLKKVIKTWQQSETKIPQLSPTQSFADPPDNLQRLKDDKNKIKKELADLKEGYAQRTKDGITIPKEHKQLLKTLYEKYCDLKAQIESLEPSQDDKFNQLKARKRELQEKIHQYQEEFQTINGHPIQTPKDIEPLKEEYAEYKMIKKELESYQKTN